ncbi:MAG: HTTM domain-containing protein [Saprospiraceae bacterium]|nr:HTTM domain-containing protein [Saprospiraceae bacterium]
MRVIIGAMLIFSTLRFIALGWVNDHYVCPTFHFKYFGFEWIEPLPGAGMYAVHGLLLISSLGVMLGGYFRYAAWAQFLLFTYTELIDLTYYLNHYYFVSIACFLLALTPANRAFSLDAWRKPSSFQTQVPRWTVFIFQLQLAIVYIFAGCWKINSDWLLHALPLKIWIPANDRLPVIGWLMRYECTPWLFSWAGMLYDVTIVFWLMWSRTRLWAYLTVIFFHSVTGMMFQIGVFPLVMMGATLVFFSEEWHKRWQNRLRMWGRKWPRFCQKSAIKSTPMQVNRTPGWIFALLLAHFVFQIVFPWRYLLYPGNVFWTEEGYRFSWRVMLMEKAGTAVFYVKDSRTGREGEVLNGEFLNPHQEKQMAMQPDLILQYAHFLKKHYEEKGLDNPTVRAEVYVTLNARPSQLLFDPELDLTKLSDGWSHKTWITPAPVSSGQ